MICSPKQFQGSLQLDMRKSFFMEKDGQALEWSAQRDGEFPILGVEEMCGCGA